MSEERIGLPIGDVDHVETIVGLRGWGKSTYLIERAWNLKQEWGAYAIGHSPGARLPRELPDGRKMPIVYHPDMVALERGLRKAPDKIHVLARGEADQVVDFARELSVRLRKQAWRDEHGMLAKTWTPELDMKGIVSPPIIVIIDEAVALRSAQGNISKRRDDDAQKLKEALFGSRHEHIAYFWSIQNAGSMSWVLMQQSTTVTCFHMEHEWALNDLRAAGFQKEQLEQIQRLDGGEFVQKVNKPKRFVGRK